MKIMDIPVLAIFFTIPLLFLSAGGRSGGIVQIESPEGLYRYSLDEDRTVSVTGPLGETLVQIRDGEARIVSSPCPNGSCMRGGIERYPGTLVCLPNQVIVSIEGGEAEADAASW